MLDVKELTPAQVAHANIAGIPASRPGLLGEYPRMLYRAGTLNEHNHLGAPIKVHGKFDAETLVVDNAEEEADAVTHGWARTPDPTAAAAVSAVESDKDKLIAELQAQLAAKPRVGRPPKQDDTTS